MTRPGIEPATSRSQSGVWVYTIRSGLCIQICRESIVYLPWCTLSYKLNLSHCHSVQMLLYHARYQYISLSRYHTNTPDTVPKPDIITTLDIKQNLQLLNKNSRYWTKTSDKIISCDIEQDLQISNRTPDTRQKVQIHVLYFPTANKIFRYWTKTPDIEQKHLILHKDS